MLNLLLNAIFFTNKLFFNYKFKANRISNYNCQMEKQLDLPKLKSMIKNGIASIPKDPNADQAVIVIGDTGVGKSTILAFLSGQ